MEYWIWSNLHGAWEAENGYTFLLHEAKRMPAMEAIRRIQLSHEIDDNPLEWPSLVAIPVTNNYLPEGALVAMREVGVNPYEAKLQDVTPEERAEIVKRFEDIWARALREEKK